MAILLAGNFSAPILKNGQGPQHHTEEGDQSDKIGKSYQGRVWKGTSFSVVRIRTEVPLRRYPMEGLRKQWNES